MASSMAASTMNTNDKSSSSLNESLIMNHNELEQDLDLEQSTGNNEDETRANSNNNSNTNEQDEDELEEIKARVREMEEEAEKLKQMQDDITSQISNTGSNDHSTLSPKDRAEIDSRSIYVGNVDYSATADDLEKHFHGCGSINRVTILCDKYTGHPKGFAYIEFADKDSVETATALDETLFKGRQIKVNPKRTNRPGLSTTNRPPRGRGIMAGRGGGRGAFGAAPRGGFGGGPWFRGRGGRGFRRGGWYSFSPY